MYVQLNYVQLNYAQQYRQWSLHRCRIDNASTAKDSSTNVTL